MATATRPENALAGGRRNQSTPAAAPPPYQHQNYPAVRHRKDGLMRIVRNEQEDAALGDAFSDKPPSVEEALLSTGQSGSTPAGTCATCVRLTMEKADMEVRFGKAWAGRTEEMELLSAQNEALTKDAELSIIDAQTKADANAELRKEHAAMAVQNEALLKQVEGLLTELDKKNKKPKATETA